MSLRRTLLTVSFALLALAVRGALEYVVYDLATPEAMHETVTAADVANLAYRTGSKMLFVRDTSLADPVYIGAYEVTEAQARVLEWLSNDPEEGRRGVAYGFSGNGSFTANHSLANFPRLVFPTEAQWEAYAGDKARPCNVFGGLDAELGGNPYTPTRWFELCQPGVTGGYTLTAAHGAFDMYGNVAEYVSEGRFRGGCALNDCKFSDLDDWFDSRVTDTQSGFGLMGARLVYTPPEAMTYTAQVTLDGEAVGEPIRATPGTTVTLTAPEPAEGYRLQGPEVTPVELEVSEMTFTMPVGNVTFAYTSKAYATLQVEGGSASASEVFAGDVVTLTATPGEHEVFAAWTLPDGSTSLDNPLTYTVPEIAPGGTVTPGTTLTFKASYTPEAQYTAQVTCNGEVRSSATYYAGTRVTLTPPGAIANHRLLGPTVSPEGLTHTGTTFTMPAVDVTFAYTQAPCATIEVVGGTASVSEAITGEQIVLTAPTVAHQFFDAWTLPDGTSSSNNPLIFPVPAVTPGQTLTFTARYTPEPKYTAEVTLDGTRVASATYYAGAKVTLAEPDPGTGYRLLGPTVTPANLAYSGTTFTMPKADVTFAYTRQAYAYIKAEGGTASARLVYTGESVTLTAAPGKYQAFKAWTLPDGKTTSSANPLSYTLQSFTPGETLTFTASFQAYPRVLVYGGTATLSMGTPYGEGFYSPKARLTLSAPAPTGYTFSGWTVSAGSSPSGNAYTVGSYDSTVTLTANFTPTTVYNDTTTYIGEADHTASTKTMRAALGYEIVGYTTKELGSSANRFGVFPYNKPSGDYAKLDLENKRIEYGSSVRNSDTNKSTILPLKRVTAGGSTYYLGIYETTTAHVEYIKRLADASYTVNEAKTTSYIPHEVTSLDEARSYLATLNAAFPMSATLPSREQIVNITATYCKDKNYPGGAGFLNAAETYGDPTIKEEMMWFNHSKDGPTVVGSMDVDPYGFYDLWGNANELWSDGKLWGGSFNQPYAHYCNAEATDGSFANYNWASFRPLSVVPETTAVKVVVDGGSFETSVLANQTIYLAPQVKTGCDFTGWTATTASGTKAVAKSGSYYPYTVTEAVTLTASFKAKPVLSVAYTNCTGPSTVLPGATVTLYAANPTGDAPTSVTISPASAATWNKAAGTLTFAASASGNVTIKATYPAPAPAKPGYRVRVQ